jgi:hypothetical protein
LSVWLIQEWRLFLSGLRNIGAGATNGYPMTLDTFVSVLELLNRQMLWSIVSEEKQTKLETPKENNSYLQVRQIYEPNASFKHLLLHYALCADRNGMFWRSLTKIHAETNLSEATILRAHKYWKETGVRDWKSGGDKEANTYQLHLPAIKKLVADSKPIVADRNDCAKKRKVDKNAEARRRKAMPTPFMRGLRNSAMVGAIRVTMITAIISQFSIVMYLVLQPAEYDTQSFGSVSTSKSPIIGLI